jgi:hypothetical protein
MLPHSLCMASAPADETLAQYLLLEYPPAPDLQQPHPQSPPVESKFCHVEGNNDVHIIAIALLLMGVFLLELV